MSQHIDCHSLIGRKWIFGKPARTVKEKYTGQMMNEHIDNYLANLFTALNEKRRATKRPMKRMESTFNRRCQNQVTKMPLGNLSPANIGVAQKRSSPALGDLVDGRTCFGVRIGFRDMRNICFLSQQIAGVVRETFAGLNHSDIVEYWMLL